MKSIDRHQFWLVGALVMSGVWFYVSQGSGSAPAVRSAAPVSELSVLEARELIDRRRPVVLDVREKDAYDKGRLPGAIAVPIRELGRRIDALGLARTEPVLVYCGDGSTRGPDAVRQLNARGHEGAMNLKGGFSGWQAAAQPVAR